MTNGIKIFEKVKEAGYDAAVFFDEISQRYLTGFHTTDGIVLVSEHETALITDSRYFEAATIAKNKGELEDDCTPYLFTTRALDVLSEHIQKKNIASIAFDKTLMTVAQSEMLIQALPKIRIGSMSAICAEARRHKSKKEIENIKAAQAITDAAFAHILKFIREGVTETEIAAELEYFCRKNGADGMAFDTITVSGTKTSLPHGVPAPIPLTKNAFITMDFGAKYNGYCSDMTRTVVLGKADRDMQQIYQTVLTAQQKALDCIKSGVAGCEVDNAARSYIYSEGYEGYFGHSTGHSLGLEIHEEPRFSSAWKDKITAGAVMTVEPGIYIPGKGGVRIEDMVLVTENGYENLTKSVKELIEI